MNFRNKILSAQIYTKNTKKSNRKIYEANKFAKIN